LYFLQQVSKVDPLTSAYIVGAAAAHCNAELDLFGWLSDTIGRKPVILGGMLLAAITYYPLYFVAGKRSHAAWQHQLSDRGSSSSSSSFATSGWCMGRSGRFLAEYFPGRIRYTSVSVPYHIGNGWGGRIGAVQSPRRLSRPPAASATP